MKLTELSKRLGRSKAATKELALKLLDLASRDDGRLYVENNGKYIRVQVPPNDLR